MIRILDLHNNMTSALTRCLLFISYVCSTDPADVARVESRTFICTPEKYETVPRTVEGVKCTLGNWMDPDKMESELADRFPGCMQGTSFICFV